MTPDAYKLNQPSTTFLDPPPPRPMSMSTSMSMPNVPLYPPQQYPAQYAQQQSLTRVTRGLDSEDSEDGGGYDDNGNDNGNGRGSQVRVWARCMNGRLSCPKKG